MVVTQWLLPCPTWFSITSSLEPLISPKDNRIPLKCGVFVSRAHPPLVTKGSFVIKFPNDPCVWRKVGKEFAQILFDSPLRKFPRGGYEDRDDNEKRDHLFPLLHSKLLTLARISLRGHSQLKRWLLLLALLHPPKHWWCAAATLLLQINGLLPMG